MELSGREELQAVNEMLQLRSDLKEIYEGNNLNNEGKKETFPYMNDYMARIFETFDNPIVYYVVVIIQEGF